MACELAFRLLESGTPLVVNAGVVLTAATDLKLTHKKPNGTDKVTKTLLASDFTIGTINFTNDVTLEVYTAFEYIIYPMEVGVLDVYGTWKGILNYQIPGDTPPVDTPGCEFDLIVLPAF